MYPQLLHSKHDQYTYQNAKKKILTIVILCEEQTSHTKHTHKESRLDRIQDTLVHRD